MVEMHPIWFSFGLLFFQEPVADPPTPTLVSVEPSSVVQGTTVAVTFRLDSTLRKIALATGEVTTVGARGQFTATDMSGFGRYGKAHDFPGRLSAVMRPPEVDRKCGIV